MKAGELPDLTPLHSLAEEVTGKPDRLCRETLSAGLSQLLVQSFV
jgi:hypothetical protein